MAGALRIALFAGTLAVGSWLGLGKPTVEDARAWVTKVKAGADARADAKANANANAGADAKSDARADADAKADARALGGSDLGSIPSMRPWPELNAEASIPKAWMVAEGPAYRAGSGRRLVTLTFDDGPFPETTPTVLKILAKNKVHASFFVIGRYLDGDDERARQSRDVLEKVAAAGHLIGNHTHDHANLGAVTHTEVLEQIDQGAASIERVTGKRPILFRPPFGKLDDFGQQAVRERGLDLVLWSVEKQDMQREDSHEVFRELVGQIEYKEGGVVLLHDIRWTSIAVLRELLGWLREHRWDPKRPARFGYEIVDLPTYLHEVAAAPLPYATRDALERDREAAAHERGTTRPATVSRNTRRSSPALPSD
ncbi:MAG: polysaccharide deacetylase [Myxococcaceae bacterium]|nr:polysaccharide deacetylase [Myxococcaceae bacterium]